MLCNAHVGSVKDEHLAVVSSDHDIPFVCCHANRSDLVLEVDFVNWFQAK